MKKKNNNNHNNNSKYLSVAYYQNTCAKLGEWTQKVLFLVLGLFPVGFSVFAAKNFGLSVLLSVAGYSCSLFRHLVFGFQQQHKRFFGFGVRCGFQFSYSCYSVSGFFVFRLHAMTLLRGMRDKPEWPYQVVALLKSNYAWNHRLTKNHRGYRGKKWQRKLRMKVKR